MQKNKNVLLFEGTLILKLKMEANIFLNSFQTHGQFRLFVALSYNYAVINEHILTVHLNNFLGKSVAAHTVML